MTKKKSKKKSIKKNVSAEIEDSIKHPDELDIKTRRGMILMGYFLFFVGSLAALIIGYAGQHKKGAKEVILIGWLLVMTHFLIILANVINPSIMGLIPIKIVFIMLIAVIPIFFIMGFIGFNQWWGKVFRDMGILLIVPHYILIVMMNPTVIWDGGRGNDLIMISNLRAIQSQIEKYAIQHEGEYPSTLESLKRNQTAFEFPSNPYLDSSESMRQIDFGTSPFEGNYTYLPVFSDDKTIGYYLIGYGRESKSGKDINQDGTPDHVLLVLNNNAQLPPVDSLL